MLFWRTYSLRSIHSHALQPTRRNKLVSKLNDYVAAGSMRLSGAWAANDLAERVLPVFPMRDLARQG
jgi:hypothetical protein